MNGFFSPFFCARAFHRPFSPPALDRTPSQNIPPIKSFVGFRLVLLVGAWRHNKRNKKDLAFCNVSPFFLLGRRIFSVFPFFPNEALRQQKRESLFSKPEGNFYREGKKKKMASELSPPKKQKKYDDKKAQGGGRATILAR